MLLTNIIIIITTYQWQLPPISPFTETRVIQVKHTQHISFFQIKTSLFSQCLASTLVKNLFSSSYYYYLSPYYDDDNCARIRCKKLLFRWLQPKVWFVCLVFEKLFLPPSLKLFLPSCRSVSVIVHIITHTHKKHTFAAIQIRENTLSY